MSKNVVVFREPKLKPLPPSITKEAMSGAQLPMRLERAKQAIAECYDLSELLTWKDQAAAICAAAKAAKMPELARGANRVCKEALLRLGQLLNAYTGAPNGKGKGGGSDKSDRRKAADSAGVTQAVLRASTRLAGLPGPMQRVLVEDDQVTGSPHRISGRIARLDPRGKRNGVMRSDSYVLVMGSNSSGNGLNNALRATKYVNLSWVRALAPDEKKVVRAKVTEILELLDAIDEACI